MFEPQPYKPNLAPLTDVEKIAATAKIPAPADVWEPLVSVPQNIGKPDFRHRQHGLPVTVWEYRKKGWHGYIARYDNATGKQILPWTYCRNSAGEMKWKTKGFPKPRPLYHLPELLAHPDAPVIVTEGEKAADAAQLLLPDHIAVTSPGGSNAAYHADWSALSGRKVIIWPDHDESGNTYAATVAKLAQEAEAASVSILTIPNDKPQGWDAADALAEGWTQEKVITLLDAPEASAADPFEAELSRLASLSSLEYDQCREASAKALGIRVGTLDKEVHSRREALSERKHRDGLFPLVEPWPHPVQGTALLDEIYETIGCFIICEPETTVATTLWIAFTWLIDSVQVAPLAIITAPEKRCGKTQLLNLIGSLSCRPLMASNISPAAMFRVIEAHAPTLLIDEADTFLRENEELRGVINSGHTRQSAYVIRTVGDTHEPTQFSTWGAKAISGIGTLPETIMDRAVILELRRKLPKESVERLRHAEPGLFTRLASMLARFAEDAAPAIAQAKPALPEALNDRAQDNWEPLLAIADHVGGEWPQRARHAALQLSGYEQKSLSLSAELLADIQEVFETKGVSRLSTAELLQMLTEDDLKPWATYNRGKPMTPRQVAKRLGEYGIAPKNIRTAIGTPKGYERDAFVDAWKRYLANDTAILSATPPQVRISAAYRTKLSATASDNVADKNSEKHSNINVVADVADKTPLSGGREVFSL